MKGSAFYGKSNQSPLNKALVGKQGNLPEHLKAEIEAAPGKMYDSPTKMKSPAVAEEAAPGQKRRPTEDERPKPRKPIKRDGPGGQRRPTKSEKAKPIPEKFNKPVKEYGVKAALTMKSPVKGKFIDALKKGEFKKAGKVLSHEAKGIGAGAKEMLDDDYGGRSKGYRMELMYDRAKNKSIRLSKADKAKKNKDDAAKTK